MRKTILNFMVVPFVFGTSQIWAASCLEDLTGKGVLARVGSWLGKAKALTSSFMPQLDQPKKELRYVFSDVYIFRTPVRTGATYAEGPQSDKSDLLWTAYPYATAEEKNVNGRDLITARLCEFFGYVTTQPRISELKHRAVLVQKDLRQSHGFLKTPVADSSKYRQLRLVSALVGKTLKGVNTTNPEELAVETTVGTLGLKVFKVENQADSFVEGEFSAAGGLSGIMEIVDVKLYPVDHPWRRLNVQDANAFLSQLAKFTDGVINSIVAGAQLDDQNVQRKIVQGLKEHRDAMKRDLGAFIAAIDPGPGQIIGELEPVQQLLAKKSIELSWAKENGPKEDYIRLWQREHIVIAEKYLKEFAAGRILDVKLAEKLWSFYQMRADVERNPKELQQFLPVLSRAFEIGEPAKHFASEMFNSFVRSGDQKLIRAALDIVREKYYGGHSESMKIALRELWHPVYEGSHIPSFLPVIQTIKSLGEGYHDLAEILLFSVIDRTLYSSRFAETALSRGGGFHNAQDVSKSVEGGALAIEEFLSVGTTRSLTARLELDKLAKLFRAMKYDSLGRRGFGQGVTPHEAFGLNGTTRSEKFDPYKLINDYIAGRTQTLQIDFIK